MKSRFSKKKIILSLFLLMLLCAVLAACNKTFLPEKHGYTVIVVYDANGGRYSNADVTGIKTYKYMPSVSIMEPGGTQNAQFTAPTMNSKHVTAWYPAVLDENGSPVKNEDGSFQLQDTPWNFSADKLPDEDGYKLYLVAYWSMNYTLTIDVGEEARAAGVENMVKDEYTSAGPVSRPGIDPVWNGYTFHCYTTESGERLDTAEDWAKLILSDDNPSITIYAKWLKGVWTIVTSSDQLKTVSNQSNYILDADIDMGGKAFGPVKNYAGTFDGNGYTIYNFKATYRQSGISDTSVGLFSFRANGCIRNVTFKQAELNVTLTTQLTMVGAYYSVGFLCGNGTALDLSSFTDIGFIDCKLTISKELGSKDATVVTGGETSYKGVFGTLSQDQQYVPLEGSNAVDISIT